MTDKELAKRIIELYVEKYGPHKYGPYIGSSYYKASDDFSAVVFNIPKEDFPPIYVGGYDTPYKALSALLDKLLSLPAIVANV